MLKALSRVRSFVKAKRKFSVWREPARWVSLPATSVLSFPMRKTFVVRERTASREATPPTQRARELSHVSYERPPLDYVWNLAWVRGSLTLTQARATTLSRFLQLHPSE